MQTTQLYIWKRDVCKIIAIGFEYTTLLHFKCYPDLSVSIFLLLPAVQLSVKVSIKQMYCFPFCSYLLYQMSLHVARCRILQSGTRLAVTLKTNLLLMRKKIENCCVELKWEILDSNPGLMAKLIGCALFYTYMNIWDPCMYFCVSLLNQLLTCCYTPSSNG